MVAGARQRADQQTAAADRLTPIADRIVDTRGDHFAMTVDGHRHASRADASGGITAMVAARHPELVRTVVLVNPLFRYKRRLIDEKPYWSDDRIDAEAGRELAEHGFVAHSPSFKVGLPLLNELFWLQPAEEIRELKAPTLILHGTGDTFIPVESSRDHIQRIPGLTRLIEIEGAQHGIAVHDDPQYLDPQTQRWQAQAIVDIADWVTRHG